MQINTWQIGKVLTITGIAGMVIGLGISLAVPRQYASKAVIKIVPSVSSDAPVTDESVTNYVNRLTYGVMSQSSLTSIIEAVRLYGGERANAPSENIIDHMRRRITVRPEKPKLDAKTAFIIQFVDSNPVLAQRVTQELAARFMDENVR